MNGDNMLSWGMFIGFFAIYLIINLIVVIKSGKNVKGIGDFALGGYTLGPVVIAFSFFATRLSASTYLGEPGFTYAYGWPYSWIGVFNAAFWLAVVLIVTRRIRLYSEALGSLTVPDFIGRRYDSNFLRIWTSLACSVFYILLIVAQYKGIVALFNTLLGIPSSIIIIAFSIVALIYVNIGGFKSVVYTDFIQGILMVIIATVMFITVLNAGGWSFAKVNTELASIDPQLVATYQDSGLFSLTGVIFLPLYLFISLATNPYCTIRLMAITNVNRKQYKTFGITLLSIGMICMMMYIVGIFGRTLFPNLSDADTIVPTVAANLLPQWMMAIFAVGMFAAIISTVDSMLHTMSTMLAVDVYQKSINPKASDIDVAKIARIITFVLTLLVMIIAFIQLPAFLSLLGLIAAAGSGLVTLSPLIVGLYWDKASKAGAIASSILGVASFAFFYWVIPINVWERGCLAAGISLVAMYIISKFTKPVPQNIIDSMKGKTQEA